MLPRQLIVGAVTPHAVSCQDNSSLHQLLESLNGLFAERGFVTTQAWLPEQNIAATGRLVLRIIPGRVDRIVYREKRPPWQGFLPRMADRTSRLFHAAGTGSFFRRAGNWWKALDDDLERLSLLPPSHRFVLARTIREGDILQLDRLQDTLDALNRVPSQTATADLAPGSRPATSRVDITNRIEDTFRLRAGYDTDSIEGVGRLRFGITAEMDNLIGINDAWSLTLRSGSDTNELAGSFRTSVRNLIFRAAADWQESATILTPSTELFVTTWNASTGVDWLIADSRSNSTRIDLTLKHRHQNRYINAVALSGQRVTTVSGGMTHSRFFERDTLTFRIGVTAGLPVLNANRDADNVDEFTPRNQFIRIDGSAQWAHVFPGVASLSSSVIWQWADVPLYSDDQIAISSRSSITSPSGVRGYSSASLSADSGFVWRSEAAFAVSVPDIVAQMPLSAERWRSAFSRFNPYVFADGGLGRDNASDITGYRVSTGLGLRYGGPWFTCDFGYAFRIAEDEYSVTDDAIGELFATLRLKIF